MIRLFNHTETNFTHNGVHVLDDIVIGDTCILNNEINGVYSLECEVAMFNNSKWKDIEAEMFLRVPTPNGEQIFRIKEIVKGFNTLKIYAKHVFFDLENNFILDTNVVKKDGRSAIAQILGGMSNNMLNAYTGTSDISIINSSRLVRKNVVTALIGNDDNSFLNRWGGELQVDNFNFAIKNRIGNDRGFQVRYGKNATGYEGNINTYNLCTRIVPVGFDGIMLEGTKWVDSPNIAKYPQIYTYEVKFDDIKVKENADDEEGFETIEEARDALRQAALNHFNNTKCDLPSFSARVSFITLQNTEEYKDVKSLERVELGDDVSIYLGSIDVNASSRIVRTKYNFFTQKYIEVEVGDIKPNLFKQLINIKDTIDNIVEDLGGNTWQDIINKSLDEATKLMEEGLKDSHVITMKNQIVIGDAPDIKDMVNCIVFNKNGIGFSNDGYLPDRLVSAMTIDGKINASCITTGELNAALIKTGVLMSANGKTWINMEDGTFNFSDKIKFDGENFDIDLSSKDIATNGDIETLQTQIKANAEGLESKVSSGDVSSIIKQDSESVKIGFNGISDTVYFAANGMILKGDSEFWGVIKSVAPNGNYAELRPVLVDGGHISYQLWLGSTKSDFKVKWNGGSEMAYFGAGGFQTDNYMTLRNLSDSNKTLYFSDGVIRPASGGYGQVGTESHYFNKVNTALVGRDRTDGKHLNVDAGTVFLRSNYGVDWGDNGVIASATGYFRPYTNLAWALGSPNERWSTVYANALNYPSDIKLKENIKYIQRNDISTLSYNIADLTTQDLYDFIKSDLKLAEFNYKLPKYRENEKNNSIGFIAQDVENTKVGNKILRNDGEFLSYDNANLVSVVLGALQKAIDKIEVLEEKIKILEGGV